MKIFDIEAKMLSALKKAEENYEDRERYNSKNKNKKIPESADLRKAREIFRKIAEDYNDDLEKFPIDWDDLTRKHISNKHAYVKEILRTINLIGFIATKGKYGDPDGGAWNSILPYIYMRCDKPKTKGDLLTFFLSSRFVTNDIRKIRSEVSAACTKMENRHSTLARYFEVALNEHGPLHSLGLVTKPTMWNAWDIEGEAVSDSPIAEMLCNILRKLGIEV